MAVKYSGILRFADEIKAEIDLAADGAVEKAVIIDGEGAETPIGGGASDFTTAEVTLVNSGETNIAVVLPVFYEAGPRSNAYVGCGAQLMPNETVVCKVPLYKGHCNIVNGISGDRMQGVAIATSFSVTSGSATSSLHGVDITGKCTITISAS